MKKDEKNVLKNFYRFKYYDEKITSSISAFLDDKAISKLHVLSKTILFDLRDSIPDHKISGPYLNMVQLLLSAPQYFSDETHGRVQITALKQWKNSWAFYRICIDNQISKPALLYKMRDSSLRDGGLYEIDDDSSIQTNSRKYPADDYTHTWIANLAWMLGHIHLCHEFLVVSPLLDKYIMRRLQQGAKYVASDQYSAFSKEMAAAFKAQYKVTEVTEDKNRAGKFNIRLTPTLDQKVARQLRIKDIDPKDAEVKKAIDEIKTSLTLLTK